MAKFWELLSSSIIVQSVITTLLVVTNVVLWLTGQEGPQDLSKLTYVVVAFWMGTKTQHTAQQRATPDD